MASTIKSETRPCLTCGETMEQKHWKRSLAALWVAQTLTMVAFSFVFPFFPLYIQSLGVTDPADAARWASAVISAMAVSMAFSQPIWGSIADRVGRKPMVVRSMIGACVTVGLMGFVSSVEQLLVLRFIQGTVTGTVAAGNALAASSVPRNRLGFVLGLMQVALFVGMSVGPVIGGAMADFWGYRFPFYAAAVLMVAGAFIVMAFVKEEFEPPVLTGKPRGAYSGMRGILGITAVPLLITVVFMIQLGGVIVAPVISLFIAELSGGERAGTAAGLVLGATGVASAVSAVVLGRLGDRIGHGRILPICLLGAAITYFPQGLVSDVGQLLVLRILLGACLGGLMPSANALLVARVPHDQRGVAFGLTSTAASASNIVGPVSGAAIAAQWGMRSVFWVTGALYLLAYGWAALGLRRSRRQPGPEMAGAEGSVDLTHAVSEASAVRDVSGAALARARCQGAVGAPRSRLTALTVARAGHIIPVVAVALAGVTQFGRVSAFQADCRRFESGLPLQNPVSPTAERGFSCLSPTLTSQLSASQADCCPASPSRLSPFLATGRKIKERLVIGGRDQ